MLPAMNAFGGTKTYLCPQVPFYGHNIAPTSVQMQPPLFATTNAIYTPPLQERRLVQINGQLYIQEGYFNSMSREEFFRQELLKWQRQCQGRSDIAYHRILQAFYERHRNLDLSGLSLNFLPQEISQLAYLQALKLDHNALSFLPACIGSLRHLQVLDLSKNHLRQLPTQIGELKALKELDCSFNQLRNIPPQIAYMRELEKLSIHHNQLQSLPSQISFLEHLRELQCFCNQLREICPQIRFLQNLLVFNCSNNPVEVLPKEIGMLSNLRFFNCSNCNLQELPPEIACLRKLQELCCYHNHLTRLPENIYQLHELQRLDVHENQLQALPQNFATLHQLRQLQCYSNQIYELPRQVALLPKLQILDCFNNQIHGFQQELFSMPELRLFRFFGNPASNGSSINIIRQAPDVFLDACSLRVQKWQQAACYTDFIEIPEDAKDCVDEWLRRLERSAEYLSNRHEMAKIVCQMLTSLKERSFYEQFMEQIQANNEECSDRASMGLNEIYACWKIHHMDPESSMADKIKILLSAAKTFALRQEIAKKIDAYEKQSGRKEQEGVEIYLFYEVLLKERLGLLSAVNALSFSEIGERSWIDPYELQESVQNNCLEELIKMPTLEHLLEEDAEFLAQRNAKKDELQQEMERIDEHKMEIGSERYQRLSQELLQRFHNNYKEAATEYCIHCLQNSSCLETLALC